MELTWEKIPDATEPYYALRKRLLDCDRPAWVCGVRLVGGKPTDEFVVYEVAWAHDGLEERTLGGGLCQMRVLPLAFALRPKVRKPAVPRKLAKEALDERRHRF